MRPAVPPPAALVPNTRGPEDGDPALDESPSPLALRFYMDNPFASSADKLKWLALAAGSAMIAGFAARNLLRAGWRVFTDDDPPMNPAALDTEWSEAVTWTVMTGVAAGLASLLARRGAASTWQSLTGSRPPALNEQ